MAMRTPTKPRPSAASILSAECTPLPLSTRFHPYASPVPKSPCFSDLANPVDRTKLGRINGRPHSYIIDPTHKHYVEKSHTVLTHVLSRDGRLESAWCGCFAKVVLPILPFIKPYTPPPVMPRSAFPAPVSRPRLPAVQFQAPNKPVEQLPAAPAYKRPYPKRVSKPVKPLPPRKEEAIRWINRPPDYMLGPKAGPATFASKSAEGAPATVPVQIANGERENERFVNLGKVAITMYDNGGWSYGGTTYVNPSDLKTDPRYANPKGKESSSDGGANTVRPLPLGGIYGFAPADGGRVGGQVGDGGRVQQEMVSTAERGLDAKTAINKAGSGTNPLPVKRTKYPKSKRKWVAPDDLYHKKFTATSKVAPPIGYKRNLSMHEKRKGHKLRVRKHEERWSVSLSQLIKMENAVVKVYNHPTLSKITYDPGRIYSRRLYPNEDRILFIGDVNKIIEIWAKLACPLRHLPAFCAFLDRYALRLPVAQYVCLLKAFKMDTISKACQTLLYGLRAPLWHECERDGVGLLLTQDPFFTWDRYSSAFLSRLMSRKALYAAIPWERFAKVDFLAGLKYSQLAYFMRESMKPDDVGTTVDDFCRVYSVFEEYFHKVHALLQHFRFDKRSTLWRRIVDGVFTKWHHDLIDGVGAESWTVYMPEPGPDMAMYVVALSAYEGKEGGKTWSKPGLRTEEMRLRGRGDWPEEEDPASEVL